MNRARFQRKGPLALAASAWGQEYELIAPTTPEPSGGVAAVMVMGPLTHHGDWWGGDTYDAIEERVSAALDTPAGTVVLKLDSPGGEVNGAFECSRNLRAMAAAKGKRLIAYVDEFAASAAYALACAADEIYLPASGQLGSIGVIDCVFDETVADAREGLQVAVITSGSRKADGNPHVAITDEVRMRIQAMVDGLAAQFFALVAESRKVDPRSIQMMEAAIFCGQQAVDAKLADGVMGWNELLAMVSSGKSVSAAGASDTSEEPDMKRSELIAAIKAALAEDAPAPEPAKDGGDQDMSKADLVAALKSLLAEDPPAPAPAHEEPDGDEASKKAAAAAAAAKPAVVTAAPAPQASTPATDPAMAMAAELQSIKAQLAADREAKERAELLGKRPDFDSKVLAMLAGKPIDYLRFAVETFPKVDRPANPLAAAAEVKPTQGSNQQQGNTLPATEANKLRAAMGLSTEADEIRWDGRDRVFPTGLSREAARKVLAANQTGGAK